ncbi:hypothetical protein BDN67DRAFT_1021268 [Paxillus ammoniavirescens]|nr:hypothetical protein BDN67DRAFT_1021268 [Paxillus ammoniavirescens]
MPSYLIIEGQYTLPHHSPFGRLGHGEECCSTSPESVSSTPLHQKKCQVKGERVGSRFSTEMQAHTNVAIYKALLFSLQHYPIFMQSDNTLATTLPRRGC